MPRRTDESFLVRWSRRKRANQQDPSVGAPDETALPEAPSSPAPESGHQEPVAAHTEGSGQQPEGQQAPSDEVPDDLKDVDVDALDYESDFTRFLEKDVPEALKRRALRQLWRSDPVLANIDGLNDYDDDFTDAALAVKVLETAHKVGRGYLKDEVDESDDATSEPMQTEGEKPDEPPDDLVAQDDAAETDIELSDAGSAPQDHEPKTS